MKERARCKCRRIGVKERRGQLLQTAEDRQLLQAGSRGPAAGSEYYQI